MGWILVAERDFSLLALSLIIYVWSYVSPQLSILDILESWCIKQKIERVRSYFTGMREFELCREFVAFINRRPSSHFSFSREIQSAISLMATVFDYRAGTIFLSPLMADATAQIRMTEGGCRDSSTLYWLNIAPLNPIKFMRTRKARVIRSILTVCAVNA